MKAFGLTDTGKVRKNNQDTFFCGIEGDGTQAVFVVCDGMGGAAAGNVASDIATAVFKDHVLKH
ncbi:MAG: serine/threonine-protein phosphatase, partial [Clostridiales bacterium]|nr:serine/threonine-protein phosphatase [Clostridiales bacterium]